MLLKKIISLSILNFIILVSHCVAQQIDFKKDKYIVSEDKKLNIVVHIWGEVNRPGEYMVPDGTNIMELISKAGGPTEYSNLGNIMLTRGELGNSIIDTKHDSSSSDLQKKRPSVKSLDRVIKINMNKYLTNKNYESLPLLMPGDAVKVGRNKWHKLQTVVRVISQVAIIAQAWYYYSRIDK